MSSRRLRVVVAAEELLVREGIQRILDQSGRVELVEGVADLPSLDAAVRSHRPHAVVTDVRLPPTLTDEGIRFASDLQRDDPSVGVLVLSEDVSSAHATTLFSGDAAGRGYLLKQRITDAAKLLEALEAVAAGELYLDAGLVREILAGREGHVPMLASLTPREHEILALMAEGKSNTRIAGDLAVTGRAVERHVGSIFAKLHLNDAPDVSRRVMAVLSYLADAGDAPAR
jgi:DNA-binding NarL/FixJ family response regulator